MFSPFHETAFKISQAWKKTNAKSSPAIRHMLERLSILLIPLPLFMLFAGTEGLIKKESPDSLASLSSISSGFFHFPAMHFLIIVGAFGVTFIIWFLTRKLWMNFEDERKYPPTKKIQATPSKRAEEL